MINIELWCIGKDQFGFVREGLNEFNKRLKHYCNFNVVYFDNVKSNSKSGSDYIKSKESELLTSKISDKDYIILLDEKGKEFDSIDFSIFIENKMIYNDKKIKFIVGGAYGFSKNIKERADELISLSKMTFSHQLIRLIFVEQLYRAFTIIKNEKYHNF